MNSRVGLKGTAAVSLARLIWALMPSARDATGVSKAWVESGESRQR
jgi:hypothetical protein